MNAIAKPRIRVAAPGRRQSVDRPKSQSGYMRNFDRLPMFAGWHPSLREASDDVKQAWRLATARTVDAFHNSGFLAGVKEQSVSAVVGNGLELDCKPNYLALGWTVDAATKWAQLVEARWSAYVKSAAACDALNQCSLHQRAAQAYIHWMATGEILATLPYFRNPGSDYRTKVRIHPAWRMSSLSHLPDIHQGVRINAVGAPVAYRLMRKMSWGGEEEFELRRSDPVGRPLVVHIFEGDPDQVRGISQFAPVLKVIRQFDQLADATLTTALIQTIFAAMFKSAASPEQVLDAVKTQGEQQDESDFAKLITSKAEWYEKTDVNLGVHGKLLHGFPGDELQFFRAEHPNATYQPFAKFLLLEASRVAACTVEEFSGDYTGATYSSIQMGTAVNWPRVERRRANIVAPLYQAVHVAWLEEEIEGGSIPFPNGVSGFLANRDFACQNIWRGPVKPQADELKTARAAEVWKKNGVPDYVIFNFLGLDVDDVYEARAREKKRRQELGIDDVPPAASDIEGKTGRSRGEVEEEEEDEAQNARS